MFGVGGAQVRGPRHLSPPPMPVMLRRLLLRENVQGYLFISPWLIGVLVFFIGPMVASLVLSLTDYSIIAPGLNFLGVENYREIAFDPLF